ncbi:hypothetical protein HMI54_012569 [Coelomomyces lativittatus]|nr:hypothetical protein HMI54_012569 [Coelomomyces lativittatus]
MFITLQTASFFLFFSTFFLNFVFGQGVKLVVYFDAKFTFPNLHEKSQNDFPFASTLEPELGKERIKTNLTKKERNQKLENSKPQLSNEKKTSLTISKYKDSFTSTIFSVSNFYKERDDNIFFASGFSLKEMLMSTSFPHYHVHSTIQHRYPEQNVVLSLIHEEEAKRQENSLFWIQDIFGKNSPHWLPVFEIDLLYNDLFFRCSPNYFSISRYLEGKKKLNLVEAKHLAFFILMICLKLEEMHLGYPEKFSFGMFF